VADELDLTREPQVPSSLSNISTIPFDRHRFREYSRLGMASALVFCVIPQIVFLYTSFLYNKPTADIKDIGEVLFAPIVGLVGAVVGFYFGAERAERES
jgi:hypothetical protein